MPLLAGFLTLKDTRIKIAVSASRFDYLKLGYLNLGYWVEKGVTLRHQG
jgi:hypothetical protein